MDLAPDTPQVMADPIQVQQVLVNLFVNAIDAMKTAPAPRVLALRSARSSDGDALLSVSDTGVGLPTEGADHMFDAFFTTKSGGTGMGLSISRSIIEAHQGRLWPAPNAPRGAVFQFTLPIHAEASGQGASRARE
jgi:signal transduction histidine kinase